MKAIITIISMCISLIAPVLDLIIDVPSVSAEEVGPQRVETGLQMSGVDEQIA